MRKRNFPFLLIQKGKHSYTYYHVDSEESFAKALLRIFEMQKANNYYYLGDCIKAELDKINREIIELENVVTCGVPIIVSEFVPKLQKKNRERIQYEERVAEADIYKKILDGDHSLLYKFLRDRSDYEYEQITSETYS